MKAFQLAQVNIAKMKAPLDSRVMADFVANLDGINALSEQSEGFVWRLKDAENTATSIKVFDDDFLIINLSIWNTKEALFKFTYSSDHVAVFKRRKEWFHQLTNRHLALWYVPSGHEPSPREAVQRLKYLRDNGETPYAFGFNGNFTDLDAMKYAILK